MVIFFQGVQTPWTLLLHSEAVYICLGASQLAPAGKNSPANAQRRDMGSIAGWKDP